MALETVTLVLGPAWTLVSGAASGPFEAFSRSTDDALYFIGDAAPADDYEFGMPRRSMSFASLTAKVWARSIQGRSLVTMLRTVFAGNATELMLPKVGLSATTFSVSAAAGADVATITGRIAGDAIESFSPNDGRIVLSADKTKFVRGLSAVSAGTFDIEIVTSHPLAPNAPKRTKITLTVAALAVYVPPTQVLLDSFNDAGHTTNVIEGAQSLLIQGVGAASPFSAIRTNSASPNRVMNALGSVSFMAKNLVPWQSTYLTLRLGRDGAAPGSANALASPSIAGAAAGDLYLGALPAGDWYPHSVPVSEYAGLDATPGKPTHRFQAQTSTLASFVPAIAIDMLTAMADEQPQVFFTFDDVKNTHRTVIAPMFKEKDKAWTIFSTPGFLNKSNGMSDQMLLECYRDYGADVGYDSRMDGETTPYAVKLGRAAGKTDAQITADITSEWDQIKAYNRALLTGGAPVRGEDNMCWAGPVDPANMPANFTALGEEPVRYRTTTATVTDGSPTITDTADIPAFVMPGMSVYTRGSGGTIPLRTILSIASDRRSMVLSGNLATGGFTGVAQVLFVDETGAFYFGYGRLQAIARNWGMKTARAGPAQSADGAFSGRNGLGGYDMCMPSISLSGMTEDNVGTFITKMQDAVRRKRHIGFYGHLADPTVQTGLTLNFRPAALQMLFNAAVALEEAGSTKIGTPRTIYAACGGRGPNIPAFV